MNGGKGISSNETFSNTLKSYNNRLTKIESCIKKLHGSGKKPSSRVRAVIKKFQETMAKMPEHSPKDLSARQKVQLKEVGDHHDVVVGKLGYQVNQIATHDKGVWKGTTDIKAMDKAFSTSFEKVKAVFDPEVAEAKAFEKKVEEILITIEQHTTYGWVESDIIAVTEALHTVKGLTINKDKREQLEKKLKVPLKTETEKRFKKTVLDIAGNVNMNRLDDKGRFQFSNTLKMLMKGVKDSGMSIDLPELDQQEQQKLITALKDVTMT